MRDDHTQVWGQAFQLSVGNQYRDRKLNGMSCQPLVGSESRMLWAVSTMNTMSKKPLREVRPTFCGAQVSIEDMNPFVCEFPAIDPAFAATSTARKVEMRVS